MKRAVIDRIETDMAVLLIGEEQQQFDIPRQQLPSKATEGTWLLVELVANQLASVQIDKATTEMTHRRIQKKLAQLRRGLHLK